MAKAKPVDRSRALPAFVTVGKPSGMPDGMTNFLRSAVCPTYKTMLQSVQIQSPRRMASANGSFGFKIESFKPDHAKIVLDMRCGGTARRVHLTALSKELSWYFLDELRNHTALTEDYTRSVTRCQNCHQQLRFPLKQAAYHNGTLVFASDTAICGSCAQQELERRTTLHDEAVDTLFGNELFAVEPPSDSSEDPLEELRDEAVIAATHQDAKKTPWWRRRRK